MSIEPTQHFATKYLRDAYDWAEGEMREHDIGTRRHSELALAQHHIMDAMVLITKGRLTPNDLVRSSEVIAKIAAGEPV